MCPGDETNLIALELSSLRSTSLRLSTVCLRLCFTNNRMLTMSMHFNTSTIIFTFISREFSSHGISWQYLERKIVGGRADAVLSAGVANIC